jgi:membrane-bound lytic murein transglycosylase B
MNPKKINCRNARPRWPLILLIPILFISGLPNALYAADKNRGFFETLQERLVADGFDAERINRLYTSEEVFFESKGVSAYFLHNEATLDYKKMTRAPWISEARVYMREQKDALNRAQKQYGVDPTVITAIKFGRYLGRRSIINTLSTMAALTESRPREYLWKELPKKRRYDRDTYEKKADQKAAWAYSELKAFLKYTQMHGVDPVSVIGSYAGALGIAQFMPSNILAYGQDGDQDGRIDLFVDADAIFSIANYLNHYGWKPSLDRKQAYKVIYHYNHSSYYVDTILEISDLLKGNATP